MYGLFEGGVPYLTPILLMLQVPYLLRRYIP